MRNILPLGAVLLSLSGCVAVPAGPPVAYAPAPVVYQQPAYYAPQYYAQPAYYAPSYYPAYYGPAIGLNFGFGGGRRGWR